MPVKFTNVEYADIIFIYGFCNGNGRAAEREYRLRFPGRRHPNHKTFSMVFQYSRQHGKFPTSAVVERVLQQGVQEHNNILNIVQENPNISTRRISSATGIPHWRVWRTLKRERYHPYHIQQVQRLEQGDDIRRLAFCRWLSNHRPVIYRTLFTDEAQFTRDGVYNSRNNHKWAQENPHAIRQRHSQHRFSVNVWIGLVNTHLIGPYFFEERLTGDIYCNFLQNILPNMLENIRIRGMLFQHDGAPPHFSIQVREHLDNEYPNRWIGRGGPHEWPPRSPDCNPCDYFLWGHLKNEVYSVEIASRQHLIQRIVTTCEEIRNNPAMIRRAIGDLTKRARKCTEVGGGHFENLL